MMRGMRLGLCFAIGLGSSACSADHHVARGRAALEAHQLGEAERLFRKALDRDSSHVAALAGLGWTYHLAGQRNAARSAFARCVDLSAEHAECLRGLGSLALAEGQISVARDMLGRARAVAPDDPKVLSSIALMELTTGDAEVAEAAYQELVARFPLNAAYRLGLAEAVLRTGRPQDTLTVVQDALSLADTPKRYRAMLWQLQARALIAASGGREDPNDCPGTAPAVREWLDAADAAVAHADSLGVALPDIPAVRRQILRRRAVLDGLCPVAAPTASELLAPSENPP